ncbi:MAG TPA: LAGLIDADG family homing endonuclease, partial [Nitrososphaerales archaeon]|nr:LAGLIDADG family homing endonuclease [Nitrososphaerales archaeon]
SGPNPVNLALTHHVRNGVRRASKTLYGTRESAEGARATKPGRALRAIDPKSLVNLYLSGATIRQVSAITMIPRETLRLRLHSLGVQMRHHPIFYHAPLDTLDCQAAELLGLHAGDGWLSKEWGLAINRNDTAMVGRAVQLVREVLGVEPFISKKPDQSISVRSGQPQVLQFFKGYGFPSGKKARIVTVPRAILESSDLEVVRAFLKGLFSADGCFSHRGRNGSCTLSVSSLGLRDGFALLASKVGFEFRKYSYPHSKGKNKVPLRIAHIGRRADVMRWMTEVGSICDARDRRFLEWRGLIS